MAMMKLSAYVMGLRYVGMSLDNAIQLKSPPSLSKFDTQIKLLSEGLGPVSFALELSPHDPVGSLAQFDTGGLGVYGNITAQKAGDVFVNSIVSSGSTTGRAFFKSIGDTGSVLVSTVYGSGSTGTMC